jgi:hypothetical protein
MRSTEGAQVGPEPVASAFTGVAVPLTPAIVIIIPRPFVYAVTDGRMPRMAALIALPLVGVKLGAARWKVSPHPEFGIPHQLAYKLDTVVVNRKIDEMSRPLPEILRIGSLRQICQEMDLKENGRTLDKIIEIHLN